MPNGEKVGMLFAPGDDPAAILQFETEGAHPELDQPVSELDQPSCPPTFDFQFGASLLAASSFHRYARGLGNPIWSRIRQTTVSATSSTEAGRL